MSVTLLTRTRGLGTQPPGYSVEFYDVSLDFSTDCESSVPG